MINLKTKSKIIILISFLFVVFDQLIKYVISSNLNLFQSIKVIENFFYITYVKNIGAAFSILSGNRLFLIIMTFIIGYFIYRYFIKDKDINLLEAVTYGILYGGIIGNLIDRIFLGYVIDYLDFKIFGYNYPVFNLADVCIVVSIILLVILILKGDSNEVSNNRRNEK